MKVLAVLLLLLFQDPDVDALLKQLSDESIAIREKATAGLIALGEKVEEKVKAHAAKAGADAKARCEAVLASIQRGRRIKELLPPLAQVTLKFKDASLREVLESFSRQTKWPVLLPEAKDGSLSVDVRDASPMEALEAIAKGVNRDFRIDSSTYPAMSAEMDEDPFDRKEKPIHVRFLPEVHKPGRPFVSRSRYGVILSRISLIRWSDFSFGVIKADLTVELLRPPDCNPDSSSQLRLDSVTADTGVVLYEHGKTMHDRLDFFNWSRREVPIEYPDPKVRKLASVKGRAILKYLLRETTMTFDSPEKSVGQRKAHKDVNVLLKSWTLEEGDLKFSLEVSGTREDAPPGEEKPLLASRGIEAKGVSLRTKDGKSWTVGGMRGIPAKGVYTLEFFSQNFEDEVVAIDVVVDRDFHTEEIQFEFRDVPLP